MSNLTHTFLKEMLYWCSSWHLSASDVDTHAFKEISLAELPTKQQQATLLRILQLFVLVFRLDRLKSGQMPASVKPKIFSEAC